MKITNNIIPQYFSNTKKATTANKSFTDILQAKTVQTEQAKPPAIIDPTYAKVTAQKKAESIYDIPQSELSTRLQQAVTVASNIDTTGLTNGEIYNLVESVFVDYLGKDFLEPFIVYEGAFNTLGLANDSFPINNFYSIYTKFDDVLRNEHNVLTPDRLENHKTYIEAKGYVGMSKDEMYAAVRSQYPENMTLKDCILMSHELGKVGLENTAYGRTAVENIFTNIGFASKTPNTAASATEAKKIFDAMLDMPASFEDLKSSIEAYRTNEGHLHFKFDIASSMKELFDILLSCFGGGELYGTNMADKLMEMLEELHKNEFLGFN